MDKFLKKRPASSSADGTEASSGQSSPVSTRTPSTSDSKRRKITPANKSCSTTKKGAKIAGKTLEQHRRHMGDQVKANITVEKWCIEARTHCTLRDVEAQVFRQLFIPNASSVVPDIDACDESLNSMPVIVASIQGTSSMAAIFGATKIKGGTRLGSWSADKGECIYFPATKEMRVWWTMS